MKQNTLNLGVRHMLYALGLILLLTESASANGPLSTLYTIRRLWFILGLLFNALIEVTTALVYALLTKIPVKKTLLPAFYANIISYPIFILAIITVLTPPNPLIFWAVVVFFEAIVILFEARLMKKMNPTLKKPLHLSLLMNATSFLVFILLFW